jgi:hypothetical protein
MCLTAPTARRWSRNFLSPKLTTCAELRGGVERMWQQIYAPVFLREVEHGGLPEDKLVFYFVQNVHYIDAAIRFSAAALARADDPMLQELCFGLNDFGRAEVGRQREYVRELPGGAEADWEIAPMAYAYTLHLVTLAAYGGAADLLVVCSRASGRTTSSRSGSRRSCATPSTSSGSQRSRAASTATSTTATTPSSTRCSRRRRPQRRAR